MQFLMTIMTLLVSEAYSIMILRLTTKGGSITIYDLHPIPIVEIYLGRYLFVNHNNSRNFIWDISNIAKI